MRKPSDAELRGDGSIAVWTDDDFVSNFPTLYHMMVDTRWDDGSPRETATLLLTVDGGTLKAWLNDRATRRSAWVSGDTLEHVLACIEAGLVADRMAWRSTNTGNRGRR